MDAKLWSIPGACPPRQIYRDRDRGGQFSPLIIPEKWSGRTGCFPTEDRRKRSGEGITTESESRRVRLYYLLNAIPKKAVMDPGVDDPLVASSLISGRWRLEHLPDMPLTGVRVLRDRAHVKAPY